MAGTAAKKAAKLQAAAAAKYFPILVGTNLWYAAVRLFFLAGERFHYYAFAGCLVVYYFTYSTAVEASSEPGTLGSYFFDVMALTLFSQFTSVFSDKAWRDRGVFAMSPRPCFMMVIQVSVVCHPDLCGLQGHRVEVRRAQGAQGGGARRGGGVEQEGEEAQTEGDEGQVSASGASSLARGPRGTAAEGHGRFLGYRSSLPTYLRPNLQVRQ